MLGDLGAPLRSILGKFRWEWKKCASHGTISMCCICGLCSYNKKALKAFPYPLTCTAIQVR